MTTCTRNGDEVPDDNVDMYFQAGAIVPATVYLIMILEDFRPSDTELYWSIVK